MWEHFTNRLKLALFHLSVQKISGAGEYQYFWCYPSVFNLTLTSFNLLSRWNRIMSNMFHRSIFAPTHDKQDQTQTVAQRRWKNSLSAMTTFAASGVFHEILTSSLFRETHGEHMAFFLLQGLAAVAEVQCLGNRYAPKGVQHVLSTSATFLWLGVTGRLFFLPFWRRTFFSL
jgi:Membrane bound O-acyl transferase family